MYEQCYGFSGKPFQINPDPGFFFEAAGHRRALAYLRYGLQQGMGFIVVATSAPARRCWSIRCFAKSPATRFWPRASCPATSGMKTCCGWSPRSLA